MLHMAPLRNIVGGLLCATVTPRGGGGDSAAPRSVKRKLLIFFYLA